MLLIGRDRGRMKAQSGSADSVEFTVRVEFSTPFFSVEITRLCSAQLGSRDPQAPRASPRQWAVPRDFRAGPEVLASTLERTAASAPESIEPGECGSHGPAR